MLLDFQMPVKTGLDVIKEVRRFIKIKNDKLDELKIYEPQFIILSSYNTAGFKNHLRQQNINQVLEKPISEE